MVPLEQLVKQIGLNGSKSLVVHSNLLGIEFPPPNPKDVYEALVRELPANHTLATPAYTLGGAGAFDKNKTPSVGVGVFSEYVRGLQDSTRTFSPLHSHAVRGPAACVFGNRTVPDSFGPASDFALFERLDFHLLLLGVDFNRGATFIHHLERLADVPYRENIELTRTVIVEGRARAISFDYFARVGAEVKTNFNKVIPLLEAEAPSFKRIEFGAAPSFFVALKELQTVVLRSLQLNPEFFLVTNKQGGFDE